MIDATTNLFIDDTHVGCRSEVANQISSFISQCVHAEMFKMARKCQQGEAATVRMQVKASLLSIAR